MVKRHIVNHPKRPEQEMLQFLLRPDIHLNLDKAMKQLDRETSLPFLLHPKIRSNMDMAMKRLKSQNIPTSSIANIVRSQPEASIARLHTPIVRCPLCLKNHARWKKFSS
jgi:hypothetical protein